MPKVGCSLSLLNQLGWVSLIDSTTMPSEDSINENIEDKFTTVKEELEELIEEVKNEVDDKGIQIANNKRYQEQSFDQIHTAMDKLVGALLSIYYYCDQLSQRKPGFVS